MNEYDKIANTYDSLFVDKESKYEDAITSKLLGNLKGGVIDIGCGTGLLVEITDISPDDYCGIDPSIRMLDIFKKKHPEYLTFELSFEDFFDGKRKSKFSNWVSLYGSISYVDKGCVELFGKTSMKKFLMFYADDYTPQTYNKTGIHPKFNKYTQEELRKIFGECCAVYRYNNYFVVQTI